MGCFCQVGHACVTQFCVTGVDGGGLTWVARPPLFAWLGSAAGVSTLIDALSL